MTLPLVRLGTGAVALPGQALPLLATGQALAMVLPGIGSASAARHAGAP